MKNEGFALVSKNRRIVKLVTNVFDALGRQYSRSFLSNVLSAVDIDKQLSIQIVSKEELEDIVCRGTYITSSDGRCQSMTHSFVEVLYGDVEVGNIHSVTDNGYRTTYDRTPTKMKSELAFVIMKQDRYFSDDGVVDMSNYSNLYIVTGRGEFNV